MNRPQQETTMQSNNPVFNNSEGFNGKPYAGFGDAPVITQVPGKIDNRRMTIDSVVQTTAVTLGVVILTALATWVLTPDLSDPTADLGTLYLAMTVGSLGAFALSMVNSFKRIVSPALVLGFAALEGVALGGLSKFFDYLYGGSVVTGAVIGTFAAFAGTLAAYKILDIKVGQKFRTVVIACVFGMLGLSLMEFVLSLFGAELGLFGVSQLGMLTAVAGLVLGVFMLIMDFDMVEQGIKAGLPAHESWRAAFGMTVSLVWIYTNLLRIMAFFSDN
jgi:uncharacterized YccA/Bax inhibitor family protein